MLAAPGQLFVRACTSDSISVTWGAAIDAFLRYRLTIIPQDAIRDTIYVYATEPDLVATFEGLQDAALYTISLELEPSGVIQQILQVTSKFLSPAWV